jgi:hypothetical protein
MAADHGVAGDATPQPLSRYPRAEADDPSRPFVPGPKRPVGARQPGALVVSMEDRHVGAAHARSDDVDDHLIDIGHRSRDLADDAFARGGDEERLHREPSVEGRSVDPAVTHAIWLMSDIPLARFTERTLRSGGQVAVVAPHDPIGECRR